MTLDEIKRLAENATPGPWSVSDTDVRTRAFVRAPKFGHVCNMPVPHADWHPPHNAASQARSNACYIAAASPDVVLAMVRVIEAATVEYTGIGVTSKDIADALGDLHTLLKAKS